MIERGKHRKFHRHNMKNCFVLLFLKFIFDTDISKNLNRSASHEINKT